MYEQTEEVACTGVFRDENGMWVLGYGRKLGNCTSLQAELFEVSTVPEIAWSRRMQQVIVECDSLEAVNLMNNNCPGLHYAANTVKRVQEFMKKGWRVELKHIPREQNELADAVAHLAQNLVYGCHILEEIPVEALSILQKDRVGVEHSAI